ncbi:hypothetical protein ACFL39_01365 [Gemmatimonadota bacterium]
MHRKQEDSTIEEIKQFNFVVDRQRRIQVAGLVIVVVFTILALITRITSGALFGLPFLFWGILAAALLLAKIIFLIATWRCPRCSGALGPGYRPRFCSKCGLEFTSSRH